jgi:hypothetical protein
MANTTNFGWETPDDTDLVKDGAAAIRTLGSAIDTSLVDLKGGTTGQVLAKASNTDMDFTWATDASGISATIFDAKGDIIAASAADTASRLAVGANNTVLTADSSTATGLKWATPPASSLTWTRVGSATATTTGLTYTMTTGYKELIYFFDVADPGSMQLRFNSLSTTDYQWNYNDFIFSNSSTTTNNFPLDGQKTINSGGYWRGKLHITNVSASKPFLEWDCVAFSNSTNNYINGAGYYNASISLTTLQFIWGNNRVYNITEWGGN